MLRIVWHGVKKILAAKERKERKEDSASYFYSL